MTKHIRVNYAGGNHWLFSYPSEYNAVQATTIVRACIVDSHERAASKDKEQPPGLSDLEPRLRKLGFELVKYDCQATFSQ